MVPPEDDDPEDDTPDDEATDDEATDDEATDDEATDDEATDEADDGSGDEESDDSDDEESDDEESDESDDEESDEESSDEEEAGEGEEDEDAPDEEDASDDEGSSEDEETSDEDDGTEDDASDEDSEEETDDGEASDEGEEEAREDGEGGFSAEGNADAEVDLEVELPWLDEDVFGSREEYSDASDEDFEDDAGDWSLDDYFETAKVLFGRHEHFGDTAHQRAIDEGFSLHADSDGLMSMLADKVPQLGETSIQLYEREGRVVPRGLITSTVLSLLEVAFPDLDLSKLHITVPKRPRLDVDDASSVDDAPRAPQGLPPAIMGVQPGDKVDLRKYASPVGDQGSTSRCAAFAWTHAREMLGNILGRPVPRLACSFTMLRFQERQGDKKDFAYAFKGGDGTAGSWQPGKHLMDNGTCREDLWPNDKKHPVASVEDMAADARNHVLDADVYDISVDDMRKVLSAGFPVQLSIATGDGFQDIGRDGVMKSAESPKGQHGYHAMLCVGYVGNYFIVKNSWGDDWGDQGYCYIPKAVLLKSEPEPVAIVPKRAVPRPPGGTSPPPGPGPGPGRSGAASATGRAAPSRGAPAFGTRTGPKTWPQQAPQAHRPAQPAAPARAPQPPPPQPQAFPLRQPQAFPPRQPQAFSPPQPQPQPPPQPQYPPPQPQAYPPPQSHPHPQAYPPPQSHPHPQAYPPPHPQAYPHPQPQAYPPPQSHPHQAYPPPQPQHAPAQPQAPQARPAQATVPCARCGAAASGKFCASCGAALPAPAPVAAKKFCTECGAALAVGAKFCSGCGGRVG